MLNALCYLHCTKTTVLLALSYEVSAVSSVLKAASLNAGDLTLFFQKMQYVAKYAFVCYFLGLNIHLCYSLRFFHLCFELFLWTFAGSGKRMARLLSSKIMLKLHECQGDLWFSLILIPISSPARAWGDWTLKIDNSHVGVRDTFTQRDAYTEAVHQYPKIYFTQYRAPPKREQNISPYIFILSTDFNGVWEYKFKNFTKLEST